MPTYQYACTACGHQLEAVQSFTDEPLRDCPSCTGRLRKVFNSVGIVFKGSGFYRTDSRSGQGSGSTNGGSSSPDKPASSDKPAEKKDAAASSGSGKTDSGGSSASSGGSSTSSGSTGSTKAPAAAGSANS